MKKIYYAFIGLAGFIAYFFYMMWKRRPQIVVENVDWLNKTFEGSASAGKSNMGFSNNSQSKGSGNLYYFESNWLDGGTIYRVSIYSTEGDYLIKRVDIDLNKREIIKDANISGDPTSAFDIVFKG